MSDKDLMKYGGLAILLGVGYMILTGEKITGIVEPKPPPAWYERIYDNALAMFE